MLQIGDQVPEFSLSADGDKAVSSASLKGTRFVLYFYPKDDTPGCTTQACSFRDNLPAFNAVSIQIFGVSADSGAAHDKFVKKFGLNFPLISDPSRALIEGMGVWVEKSMYGKKYMGIARATFVIDAAGKIEKLWEKVTPAGHAEQVLAYLAGETDAPGKKPVTKRAVTKRAVTKKPASKTVKKAL